MVEKTLKTKGVKLSYYYHKGKSPALFFIHGAGSNKSIWTPYIKAFKNHTVIAMDLRNHGKSGNAKASMKTMVDDALKILKKEKVKNVVIIGNSLGAVIAAKVAEKREKKKTKLILASLYSKEYVRARLLLIPLFWITAMISKAIPRKKRSYQNYYIGGKYKSFPFPVDVKGTFMSAYLLSAIESMVTSVSLKEVKALTLVLHGKYDWMTKNAKIKRHEKKNMNVIHKELGSHHHILTTKCNFAINMIKQFIKR